MVDRLEWVEMAIERMAEERGIKIGEERGDRHTMGNREGKPRNRSGQHTDSIAVQIRLQKMTQKIAQGVKTGDACLVLA